MSVTAWNGVRANGITVPPPAAASPVEAEWNSLVAGVKLMFNEEESLDKLLVSLDDVILLGNAIMSVNPFLNTA